MTIKEHNQNSMLVIGDISFTDIFSEHNFNFLYKSQ